MSNFAPKNTKKDTRRVPVSFFVYLVVVVCASMVPAETYKDFSGIGRE
jgi:hypothetical protein